MSAKFSQFGSGLDMFTKFPGSPEIWMVDDLTLVLNLDILQGSFRLCNWLSLRRLVSWINHLPPACWSTFWKSNFKQQLGCRFDIMDNESYFFVFWHMQLYMSWYIRSFFGFTFLNILYFFKYSCTNIFHRRSLYTFYWLTLLPKFMPEGTLI